MIFTETNLPGAFIIEPERLEDERGFFARSWCQREFEQKKLNPKLVQCDISFNKEKGTLRGMHYEIPPFEEAKLVRCTMGSVYYVIIDMRNDSPTFKQHYGLELTTQNHKMIYASEGFANGFLTLQNETEIFYQMSEFYAPEYARGFRWDDPAFDIKWPREMSVISERDRSYPNFNS